MRFVHLFNISPSHTYSITIIPIQFTSEASSSYVLLPYKSHVNIVQASPATSSPTPEQLRVTESRYAYNSISKLLSNRFLNAADRHDVRLSGNSAAVNSQDNCVHKLQRIQELPRH
ncbi:hypothetical protein FGSG_13678 [Fusarium graminearum PH-1]|uniref:Uncharacterized protein n=1 Tax=Gibberella zeae TaxID=5518 RepID=A0A4E9E8I6_GIBZA|nr:hypothetical protein FGSG_13678 [Fusarium graminearum PH-1]ESU16641.1 hypothetical protein FGSG_13678 [Fusarium graminearum PH-1]CAF3567231.1 unnamed protein product [Fusarium graminearum]CAG1974078.1 unnamed protein product [Fusarium graminearum]CAG1976970.1 unnamed protein product [Fusarium graminearum]|eukprot:XP_011318903.1 hypothetical protein FGSG_13678 [Fusarium graminearum PH-1]